MDMFAILAGQNLVVRSQNPGERTRTYPLTYWILNAGNEFEL
jgi:hypothetical protein